MSTVESCRSCAAPIIWAVTTNGKFMPVDAYPTDDGNVELVDGTPPRAIVHGQPPLGLVGELRLPHHASCPQADQWRRS